MKTVYPDGRQETRYASGRVRVKDAHGLVVLDTGQGVHRVNEQSGASALMTAPSIGHGQVESVSAS